jgi:hypothetical protein
MRIVGLLVGLVLAHGIPRYAAAQPQPLAEAVRTIFLDATGEAFSVPSSVAYHPGFDRYYASDTGGTGVPGFVFPGMGGAPLQTQTPLNIDPRAWNFNPNTGFLELVSFDAVTGGVGRGLIEARIDVSGNLTGGTTTLLPSMPGNNGSQTSPAYDPVSDVFYSRDSSSTVNVVRRSDGVLAGTILLDFTAASLASAYDDGIIFVPAADWLGVLDSAANRVVLFDRLGSFVGASALDITLTSSSRRPGYANGQLFAFDSARNGWQGFRILDVDCLTDTDCDDDDLCTDDVCGASLQCEHADNSVPCNDGNACSVNDTCSAGVCSGSLAGFDGLACLLRRLKAPGVCADAVPTKLTRFILKQGAKAQAFADRAESQGQGSFLSKARAALEAIAARAAKAAAARAASKRISEECRAAIAARVQDATTLLGQLSP